MNNREMKSKVMSIGNRLAAMYEDRAWALVKHGGLELPVRGVIFGNRQEALRRLAKYDPKDVHVILEPEPQNEYDKYAISVKVAVQNGNSFFHLGYVPKDLTYQVKALGNAKKTTTLRVLLAGDWTAPVSELYNIGARVCLGI